MESAVGIEPSQRGVEFKGEGSILIGLKFSFTTHINGAEANRMAISMFSDRECVVLRNESDQTELENERNRYRGTDRSEQEFIKHVRRASAFMRHHDGTSIKVFRLDTMNALVGFIGSARIKINFLLHPDIQRGHRTLDVSTQKLFQILLEAMRSAPSGEVYLALTGQNALNARLMAGVTVENPMHPGFFSLKIDAVSRTEYLVDEVEGFLLVAGYHDARIREAIPVFPGISAPIIPVVGGTLEEASTVIANAAYKGLLAAYSLQSTPWCGCLPFKLGLFQSSVMINERMHGYAVDGESTVECDRDRSKAHVPIEFNQQQTQQRCFSLFPELVDSELARNARKCPSRF